MKKQLDIRVKDNFLNDRDFIFLKELFVFNFPFIALDILIVLISSISLIVYANGWYRDLSKYYYD